MRCSNPLKISFILSTLVSMVATAAIPASLVAVPDIEVRRFRASCYDNSEGSPCFTPSTTTTPTTSTSSTSIPSRKPTPTIEVRRFRAPCYDNVEGSPCFTPTATSTPSSTSTSTSTTSTTTPPPIPPRRFSFACYEKGKGIGPGRCSTFEEGPVKPTIGLPTESYTPETTPEPTGSERL